MRFAVATHSATCACDRAAPRSLRGVPAGCRPGSPGGAAPGAASAAGRGWQRWGSPAGARVCDLPEARAALKRVLGDARRSKIAVEELTVPRGSVYVLGDCADVSVDSRVWGPLRTSELRARPLNTLKGRR